MNPSAEEVHDQSMEDESSATFVDEIGGTHSEGVGWNPNGEFCGECSYGNCADCGVWNRGKE